MVRKSLLWHKGWWPQNWAHMRTSNIFMGGFFTGWGEVEWRHLPSMHVLFWHLHWGAWGIVLTRDNRLAPVWLICSNMCHIPIHACLAVVLQLGIAAAQSAQQIHTSLQAGSTGSILANASSSQYLVLQAICTIPPSHIISKYSYTTINNIFRIKHPSRIKVTRATALDIWGPRAAM